MLLKCCTGTMYQPADLLKLLLAGLVQRIVHSSMPSREMILEMGPVMVSTEFLNASSSLQHKELFGLWPSARWSSW